jgi:hypothetical protein
MQEVPGLRLDSSYGRGGSQSTQGNSAADERGWTRISQRQTNFVSAGFENLRQSVSICGEVFPNP